MGVDDGTCKISARVDLTLLDRDSELQQFIIVTSEESKLF